MSIYCDICNKEFTGKIPAEHHWMSVAHRKKADEKKNSVFQSSMRPLWCAECNVQSNSQQQFQLHIVSPRHLELVQRAMRITRPTAAPVYRPMSQVNIHNQLGNPASLPDQFGNPHGGQTTNNEKEYDFNGTKGQCYVCNILLTSSSHARQHLTGSKHQKKTTQIHGGNDTNTVLSCTICNVPFSSEGNAQQHLASVKHMKRKQELEHRNLYMSRNVEETSVNMGNAFNLINPDNLADVPLYSNTKEMVPHLKPALPPTVAADLSLDMNRLTIGEMRDSGSNSAQNANSGVPYTFDGKEGYCTVCRVDFTSPQNARQHLDGVKHQRAEKLWQQGNSNQSNQCSICSVVFSGPESAQQHYTSDRHTKRSGLPPTNFTAFESGKTELALKVEAMNSLKYGSLPLNIQPDVGEAHLGQTAAGFLPPSGSSINLAAVGHSPVSRTISMSLGSSVYKTANSERTNTGSSSREGADTMVKQSYKHPSIPISPPLANKAVSSPNEGIHHSSDPPSPYWFNGIRGRCNVCEIELTSRPHANQHLTGKNHMKALARWQSQLEVENDCVNGGNRQIPYVFNGDRGFCNVCSIELTSLAHANQHLTGNPHEKALMRWNKTCEVLVSDPSAHQTRQEAEGETPRRLAEEPEYVFQGSQGHCFVCNVELTSRQLATQHLQGSNHAKAVKRRTMESRSLECKVCFKSFSGPESASQHYASAKHKSKAAMKYGSIDGQDDISSDGSRSSTPVSSYMCEVCQCPLNSFQQLSSHKMSPKHLETLEKMQSYVSMKVGVVDCLGKEVVPAEVTPNIVVEAQGQHSDLWNALRTGEISAVRGVVPNVEPVGREGTTTASVASTGNTLVGTGPPLSHSGELMMSEKSSSGAALKSSPAVNRGTVLINSSANSRLQNGLDRVLVNSGISTDVVNLNGASAFPSRRTSLPDEYDHSESNSDVGYASNTRRPNAHNILKNKNSPKGNKLALDSYDDDWEEDELPPRGNYLDIKHMDDSSTASMVSYTSQAGNILEQGPHMPANQRASTTDDNMSRHWRNPRNNSLLSDVESEEYPGSNEDQLSGFTGIGALPNAPPENPYKGAYRFYCELCKRPMNTKKDYEAHMDSRGHRQLAAEVEAPRTDLGHIRRNLTLDQATEEAYHLTNKCPRSYQVELFCKTMDGDRVIFLPTGTGKTLVSIMTMSCMLTLNPRRPVLFLVDKVLLVLQQSKVIQNEIGSQNYKRLPLDGSYPDLIQRQLKIATLCGNILSADSTPLYRHDVIVTTAAYADNLLDKKLIHWIDFSLVVFDEAHHCVKKHPFNRLLSTYHCPCAPEHRPKVLGLTASPAGRDNVQNTVAMLLGLFENLGGATVAIVQEETGQQELKKYQSNATPLINYVPYSDEETAFRLKLREYLCHCYQKLSTLSDIESECGWDLDKTATDVSEFAECLTGATIEKLLVGLNGLKPRSDNPASQANLQFLKDHCNVVILALLDMDSLGIPSAIGDLQTLGSSQSNSGFSFAAKLGIPCDDLENAVRRNSHSVSVRNEFPDNLTHITLYAQLLDTLTNPKYVDWSGRDPMVLVLVRERAHASTLSNFLKQCKFVADNSLKITRVVGHGSGQADDGMKVKAQKKVLDGVKRKRYNIVVATSVAEEGVDIPECELVVCINPPSTVTGLVQMRGRARKKDSYFVILCKSQDEHDKMRGLLLREKYMMAAAKLCVEQQQEQQRLL